MGYRDDREGLRQKAEALEDELRHVKARLEAHEGKDVEDERRIAELTSKLEVVEEEKRKERARKAAPKSQKQKPSDEVNAGDEKLTEAEKEASKQAMMPLVLVFVIGGVLLLVVLLASGTKDPAGTMSSPQSDNRPTTNHAEPAPVPTRSGEINFKGEVLEATGIALAKGARCNLTAEISSTRGDHKVGKVTVICGTELLYVRGQHFGEPMMSNLTWDFWEVAADASDGPHTYRLLFEDKGTRSSKLFQIFVDTREPKMRLWRDEPDRATVDVKISEWSEGRKGEALLR